MKYNVIVFLVVMFACKKENVSPEMNIRNEKIKFLTAKKWKLNWVKQFDMKLKTFIYYKSIEIERVFNTDNTMCETAVYYPNKSVTTLCGFIWKIKQDSLIITFDNSKISFDDSGKIESINADSLIISQQLDSTISFYYFGH